MQVLVRFYRSTVGKKVLMALSGMVLLLFVIGHMAGNLKLFLGVDPASRVYRIDHYAELLRTMGADFLGRATVLWIVRVVLLGSVILHAVTGTQLWLLNRRARPVGYEDQDYRSAGISSLTMFYGGAFLALFIVFHVLHFTLGDVAAYGYEPGRVYSNLYYSFLHGYLVLIYVIAMLCLGLHLFHGGWSLFQTLGLDTPKLNSGTRTLAKAIALLLFVGFSAVPVCIYFGLVPPPVTTWTMRIESK